MIPEGLESIMVRGGMVENTAGAESQGIISLSRHRKQRQTGNVVRSFMDSKRTPPVM